MAAFFSGDSPAAHSIRPSALERTASTASTRDRERDAGPHALSLKVMRISRPALATLERPYFEDVFYPSASLELLDAAGEGSKLSDGERHELQVGGSDRQGISREAGEAMKSLARGELLSNENESLPRSLSHNDGAETSNLAGPSTLRDWPASDMLALPNSFGTICECIPFQLRKPQSECGANNSSMCGIFRPWRDFLGLPMREQRTRIPHRATIPAS